MRAIHPRRTMLAGVGAALLALGLAPCGWGVVLRPGTADQSGGPVVTTQDGAVRGVTIGGGDEFLGLPYAAPPTGALRWRAPRPAKTWTGVRNATRFAPSCPQPKSPFAPPPPYSENCLHLNIYTPNVRHANRPVIVWIHGGGFT